MVLNIVSKFQKGLAKTKSGLVDSITRAVNKARGIDQDLLAELEEILILGDVGVQTAENIIDDLREKSLANGYSTAETIITSLKEHLAQELVNAPVSSGTVLPRPYVISIVGVNGTGKTTTIGKLGHRLQLQGKKVLVAAADTFRAAAIDQLDIWAKRAHVDIVHTQPGADPASVAFDALRAAMARNVDYLLIDTAGRLHTKSNLMAELEKIHRVINRQIPGAPHEVLLVLDATTGQNGLAQAKKFASSVNVTGIVLTKLDGTAKGGIIFSIKKELNIPLRYIGVGEQLDDLEEFDPHAFIEALFH
jgi:fused signal recognition particle receptor